MVPNLKAAKNICMKAGCKEKKYYQTQDKIIREKLLVGCVSG
jgi:hypothetical protein